MENTCSLGKFNVEDIIDIIDKGRSLKHNIRLPCGICNKNVHVNHKSIMCNSCDFLIHIACNGTTASEYETLKNSSTSWSCLVCRLKYRIDNIPFTRCSNLDLSNINNINSMKFLESLPRVEIISEVSSLSADINEIPLNTNCKYYPVHEFDQLKLSKDFNILHTNANGLESKLDNITDFLLSSLVSN